MSPAPCDTSKGGSNDRPRHRNQYKRGRIDRIVVSKLVKELAAAAQQQQA